MTVTVECNGSGGGSFVTMDGIIEADGPPGGTESVLGKGLYVAVAVKGSGLEWPDILAAELYNGDTLEVIDDLTEFFPLDSPAPVEDDRWLWRQFYYWGMPDLAANVVVPRFTLSDTSFKLVHIGWTLSCDNPDFLSWDLAETSGYGDWSGGLLDNPLIAWGNVSPTSWPNNVDGAVAVTYGLNWRTNGSQVATSIAFGSDNTFTDLESDVGSGTYGEGDGGVPALWGSSVVYESVDESNTSYIEVLYPGADTSYWFKWMTYNIYANITPPPPTLSARYELTSRRVDARELPHQVTSRMFDRD